MINLKQSVKNMNLRGKLEYNKTLAPKTWFRVGGDAQVFYTPYDAEELCLFLKSIPAGTPILPMGLASNLLVRDGGFDGIVIKLGKNFDFINIDTKAEAANHTVNVGCAVASRKMSMFCVKQGIDGFSFLHGIPGNIGGALAMNAGANGSDISQFFVKANGIDLKGNKVVFDFDAMDFSYRHCVIKDIIFTDATFSVSYQDKGQIKQQIKSVEEHRQNSQPVKLRTGGSTFKNPSNSDKKAWELIDGAGCRGLRIGGAIVSSMHCNFIINDNNASAKDIEEIITTVQKQVINKYNVKLEVELKIVGIDL